MYIYNRSTKEVIGGLLFDKKRAKTRVDKLDNEHGSYVHCLIDSVLYKHGIIKVL